MPLVLDPQSIPLPVLEELRRSLLDDLNETSELVHQPRGVVLDPSGIDAAAELLREVLRRLDRPPPTRAEELAADANLAYATMVVVIDLAKSHTDVPRVPRSRTRS